MVTSHVLAKRLGSDLFNAYRIIDNQYTGWFIGHIITQVFIFIFVDLTVDADHEVQLVIRQITNPDFIFFSSFK